MYGLVNKAVEGLVTRDFGKDVWDRVRKRAELPDEPFLAMHQYDDSLTYSLVEAAAAELEADPAELLEAFGVYWVMYVATEGYGSMLEANGDNLVDLFQSLDDMHARIALSMPQLRPPSFTFEETGERCGVLIYSSERPGLCPMVLGLVKGLAKRLDLEVEVSHVPGNDPSNEVFRVAW